MRKKSFITFGTVIAGLTICVFVQLFLNSNLVKSQEIKPPVSQTIEPEQPKFALLVGISRYKAKGINPIDGCENNVSALKETLVGKYRFEKDNVDTILINENATKAAKSSEISLSFDRKCREKQKSREKKP